MTRFLIAVISAIYLLASGLPARSETIQMPVEKLFPSSVGAVTFRHQVHVRDYSVKCVDCHHQINAKKLKTPHPDYFRASSVNCEKCHDESAKVKQKAYTCSACHHANPINIADETLSSKVVIHKQCWNCHQVGTGKEASTVCEKCHSGKKTF